MGKMGRSAYFTGPLGKLNAVNEGNVLSTKSVQQMLAVLNNVLWLNSRNQIGFPINLKGQIETC